MGLDMAIFLGFVMGLLVGFVAGGLIVSAIHSTDEYEFEKCRDCINYKRSEGDET